MLRSLVDQMRELLTEDADPGLRRLYPTAYPEDADRDEEYQRLVHDDLLGRRLAAFQVVEATARRRAGRRGAARRVDGRRERPPARDRHEARRVRGPVVRRSTTTTPTRRRYAIYTYARMAPRADRRGELNPLRTPGARMQVTARVPQALNWVRPPSSSGLGHRPFKVAARVRIPLGVPQQSSLVLWCSLECTPACQAGGRGFKSRRDRPRSRSGSSVGRARA